MEEGAWDGSANGGARARADGPRWRFVLAAARGRLERPSGACVCRHRPLFSTCVVCQANRALASPLRPQDGLGGGQLVPREAVLHGTVDALMHRLHLVQVQLRLRLARRHDKFSECRLELRHGDLVELDPLGAGRVREEQLQVQVRRPIIVVGVIHHANLDDGHSASDGIEVQTEALLHPRQPALRASGDRRGPAQAPLACDHVLGRPGPRKLVKVVGRRMELPEFITEGG